MDRVPRRHGYYGGATTPWPASLGLIVSPVGTAEYPLVRVRCAFPTTGGHSRRAGCPWSAGSPCFRQLSLRTGQGLPGFLASHPVALRRSPTPAGPWRLAVDGTSGAAPTLSRMKASTMLFRGSMASLHHLLCTLHDVRYRTPCNARFRLAGCAFAGRESNPLARDEGLLAHGFPPSRTSPGATTIWMRALTQIDAL